MPISKFTAPEDLPAHLTVPECAAWWDVSSALVRELIRRGELRHIRLGRLIKDLREQALATIAVESSRGMRIAKSKASRKIDAISALSMACVAAVEAGPDANVPLMLIGGDTHRAWVERHGDSDGEADVDNLIPNEDEDEEDELAEDETPDAGAHWSALTAMQRATRQLVDRMRQRRAARATVKDAEAVAERRDRIEKQRVAEMQRADAEERQRQEERRQAGIRVVERAIRRNGSFWPGDVL